MTVRKVNWGAVTVFCFMGVILAGSWIAFNRLLDMRSNEKGLVSAEILSGFTELMVEFPHHQLSGLRNKEKLHFSEVMSFYWDVEIDFDRHVRTYTVAIPLETPLQYETYTLTYQDPTYAKAGESVNTKEWLPIEHLEGMHYVITEILHTNPKYSESSELRNEA